MIAKVKSFKPVGIQSVPITIECEITPGIGIHLIGLADAAVKESLLRTVTALQSIGFSIPGNRVIINIAPADLHKNTTGFDLPIAVSIIAASGQESMTDMDKYIIAGELGLDASVRMIDGAATLENADLSELKGIILPTRDAIQLAESTEGRIPVYGVDSLSETIEILKGNVPDHTAYDLFLENPGKYSPFVKRKETLCYDKISKNAVAVRIAEIAAAGGHGLILIGAPGTGKSIIAKAVSELLPPMTKEEALECDKIYSVSAREIRHGKRPFRSPVMCVSLSSLLGGGTGDNIKPGEVSLAHKGVLYLEQWNTFPKATQEAIRVPLEDKKVVISRLKSKIEYPADFLPVLSTWPCPCGKLGTENPCTCTETQKKLFYERLYSPVYDRMDLQLYCAGIRKNDEEETYKTACAKVIKARKRQAKRNTDGKLNAETAIEPIRETVVDKDFQEFINKLMEHLNLSAKSYSHILRVARTIADLDGEEHIKLCHLSEAASYRFLDRRID